MTGPFRTICGSARRSSKWSPHCRMEELCVWIISGLAMFQHEERLHPDRYHAEHYSTFANYLGRYAFAGRFVGPHATVLDVGCGCGYGSAYLTDAPGRTVLGVDRSVEGAGYARKRYNSRRLEFITADATALPVTTGSLDAVVALEMIEHVADADAVVREVWRVLKPQGVFVVSTPNRLITGSGTKPANPFHVREYFPEEFRTLLEQVFAQTSLYGEALTPAFLVHQENMAKIWRNLSSLHEQVHALRSRLEMDERFTGLSLLRKLKRLLWRRRENPQASPFTQEFSHGRYIENSMGDWEVTPYQIESSPVMIAVCRK
ncbi:MAG: class I SAM-dependent methyltransferase [Nitrospirae bacterium]|nr:MAG: class I SAM-dependent methyltransferase [Nitrospirota bacterium]